MDELEIMKAANKELQRMAHTSSVSVDSELVTIGMDGVRAAPQPSSARAATQAGAQHCA
jgi:hypothetical protein